MSLRARGILAATAVSLSAAAVSCVGHLPPCPAAGGPAWTELRGAHFRLRTDDDPAAARAVLTDLEQFQASLLTVFGASGLDTGTIPVIVVDRGWTDFARRAVGGYFTHALFQPLVVMVSGGMFAGQDVVKHELVHYLSAKIMPRQPLWLSEGLATYYETLEYDARDGKVVVGRPSRGRLQWALQTGAEDIEAMFTATTKGEEDDEGRFYGAAWLAVHYLTNHRPEALLRYEKALRQGAAPEAAWAAAFGSETPAQIAADVHHYLDGGQYAVLIYPMSPPALPPPIEHRLTDADVHATRALLYLTGGQGGAHATRPSDPVNDAGRAARAEIAEALRQEPGHLPARVMAHWMLGEPVDLEQATAAAERHGDDWMAWLLLAEANRQRGDAAAMAGAVMRAVDLARTDRSVELPVSIRRR